MAGEAEALERRLAEHEEGLKPAKPKVAAHRVRTLGGIAQNAEAIAHLARENGAPAAGNIGSANPNAR